MIEHMIEEFRINKCPVCGKAHIVQIDVYREMVPNDIDHDIRVPEFKKLNVPVICPVEDLRFEMELLVQEDVYSKIVKLCKVSLD